MESREFDTLKEDLQCSKKYYPLCYNVRLTLSQSAFTCSKLTIETLEQGVKYISLFVLVFLLLTLNM